MWSLPLPFYVIVGIHWVLFTFCAYIQFILHFCYIKFSYIMFTYIFVTLSSVTILLHYVYLHFCYIVNTYNFYMMYCYNLVNSWFFPFFFYFLKTWIFSALPNVIGEILKIWLNVKFQKEPMSKDSKFSKSPRSRLWRFSLRQNFIEENNFSTSKNNFILTCCVQEEQ